MAEKEPMIVIKKVTNVVGGGHGGAWKVAFADFMTAMMAFFLVMWLVNATEDVKQNVSDYFSTPSIIEYNFSNYGVELTLEKLFLDLMNEPLRFFEQFITPADHTPNMMMMGTKKIVASHIADKLGDKAQSVEITEDQISFNIPADVIFRKGSANPTSEFVPILEKLKELTVGLEDSNVFINSEISISDVSGRSTTVAKNVADERLDLIVKQVEVSLENESVDLFGKATVEEALTGPALRGSRNGYIKVKIKQKETRMDGRKQRKLESVFGSKDESLSVYDNFVQQVSGEKSGTTKK